MAHKRDELIDLTLTIIAILMTMAAIVSFAKAQDESPCGPFLQPMETIRLPDWDENGNETGRILTISTTDNDTRAMTADYTTPADLVIGDFDMRGNLEATNKRTTRATIRFRQSIRIGEGLTPIIPLDSPVCWEPETCRLVTLYTWSIDPGQTVTEDVAWTVQLRDSDQLADINSDGRVDAADQGILMTKWGSNDPTADLNFDGTVNGEDLGILFMQWSESADDTPAD